MKKSVLLSLFIAAIHFLLAGLAGHLAAQDIFISKDGKISFFSKAPLEDINPLSDKLASVLNTKTKKIIFSVNIKTLHGFNAALQEEHFNEKYMHSDKYSKATFKGEIQDDVNLTQPGTYNVKAKGILDIHGVEQERTIDGVITVEEGKINLKAKFKVEVADHKVKIPKLVWEKVAEVVDVTIDITYLPKE